jgi:hypothetical protein
MKAVGLPASNCSVFDDWQAIDHESKRQELESAALVTV